MFSLSTACVQVSVMILAMLVLRALFQRFVPSFVFLTCWWLILFRGLLPFYLPAASLTVDAGDCPTSVAIAAGSSVGSGSLLSVAQASHAGQTTLLGNDVLPAVLAVGSVVCFLSMLLAYGICWVRLSHAAVVSPHSALAGFIGMVLPGGRTLRVRELPGLSTPISCGVFHPTVVLPKGFDEAVTEDELHLVMRHEISHLRRFDTLMKPLAALMVCLYWFNPLAWFAFKAMATDMEKASDAWALRDCRKVERAMYARTLLNAKTVRQVPATGFGTRPIESRIAAILAPKPKRMACVAACLVTLTCCFGSFALASSVFPADAENQAVTVRNGAYSFEIPACWQGRVSVRSDADSTYVFPTGYPDLPLVTFEVVPMGQAIEDNAANPVLFVSEYGDGGCLVVRSINYLWLAAGDAWRNAYVANPSYPGDEGERLAVELSTGGRYDADDARLLDPVYAGQEDEAPAGGNSVAKGLLSSIVVEAPGGTVYGPVLPE